MPPTQLKMTPARAAALVAARRSAGSAGQGGQTREIAKALAKYRNSEPWTYYDTNLLSATAGTNFAAVVSPMPFFTTRTTGNTSLAVTDMTDIGKTDCDFLATTISVDVHCDTDAAAAAGVATAAAFVETIVAYGIVQISFGQDVKYVVPVIKCPSGGGVVSANKVRTQAAAANSDSAQASNGLQTAQARRIMDEPILFRRGVAFSCNIQLPAGPLARIVALQALTASFGALVRLNLEGVRGKPLLEGTSTAR